MAPLRGGELSQDVGTGGAGIETTAERDLVTGPLVPVHLNVKV